MENAGHSSKTIKTREFGDIAIEPQYIFNFPSGILGFETLKEFVLVSVEDTAPFKWLISIQQPEIGFILLSPWLADQEFNPGRSIDISNSAVFVIIKLEKDRGVMTANMKAPIVLDAENNIGEQVILPSDKFSTNFVINANSEV
jgi:flagellar assembly factor FliW